MFVLPNFGKLVISPIGVFYLNQNKSYILTFDKISQDKFLYDFNDSQVEFVDLKIPDLANQLRKANFSFKRDRVTIELSQYVVRL